MKRFLLLISICTISIFTHAQWRISAPAESRYCVVNPAGETIIPNGRIIKPLGKTYRIAPHPYGMVMSHDGKTVIVLLILRVKPSFPMVELLSLWVKRIALLRIPMEW